MTPSPYRAVIESMFKIVDRDTRTVPFLLNAEQAYLDANWSRRNLITKIRQHSGISTYIIARFVAKCMVHENRTCVIVSHEGQATERLLRRAHFMLDHMPAGATKPVLSADRSTAIVFKATNSTFYIGTAGATAPGHGDTISDLHLSEAAFYTHPEAIRRGLFPATEAGEITIESTGNGRGNWFHQTAERARRGDGFKFFFFHWVGVPSCALALTPQMQEAFLASLRDEFEEIELYQSGISLAQLAWRRELILTEYGGDLVGFKENYPRTPDECFRAAGNSFFPRVNFKEAGVWTEVNREWSYLSGHPLPGHRYVAGADVSGGIGKDYSTLSLWDLDTQEQVGEWASNKIAPHDFGTKCIELCSKFNHAYLNVERNTHGAGTLAILVANYPLDRLHRGAFHVSQNQVILSPIMNYGTQVSEATRGPLISNARARLSADWVVHSPRLNSELGTFVESNSGKYEASPGTFDDCVFAACHALSVLEQAGLATYEAPAVRRAANDPFGFSGLFQGQTDRMTPYGISARFQ